MHPAIEYMDNDQLRAFCAELRWQLEQDYQHRPDDLREALREADLALAARLSGHDTQA